MILSRKLYPYSWLEMQINGWRGTKLAYIQGDRYITWGIFRKACLDHYFPEAIRLQE
jgi:hypothetical protein